MTPRFDELRLHPADPARWQALFEHYRQSGWPWQAQYCLQQAQRIVALTGTNLPPLDARVSIQTHAGTSLMQAMPMEVLGRPELAQAQQLAQALLPAWQASPEDWLSGLILLRLEDLQPLGEQAPDLAQVQAHEWLPGETAHLWANWRLQAGDAEGALDLLRPLVTVTAEQPLRHSSMLLLADALLRLGRTQAAELALNRAARSPNPAFLARVAERSLAWNYWPEAVALRRQIVTMRPEDPQAWLALAQTEFAVSQSGEALRSVARVLQLQPDHPEARMLQAQLHGQTGEGETYFEAVRELHAKGDPLSRLASTVAMASLYASKLSPQERADLHRQLCAPIEASIQPICAPARDQAVKRFKPRHGDRLRVGYLSGDLHRQHPVNLFLLPLLEHHDHSKLEVFIYHCGHMHDVYTARARATADTWREVGHWDDMTLAQQIHADQLDLLIDTAGHTSSHRLGVLALRPAPVQATFLGYPHSSGMSRIDFLIGDPVVSPMTDQPLYAERIVQLPDTVFCWAPVDDDPLPRRRPLAEPGEVVLGSFNNGLKLVPRTLDLWARVMQALPNARLLIKAPGLRDPRIEAHFRQALISRGVDAARFELRGPSGLADMMQEYGEVDIALDPLPYNGGTTTVQALWMGTPVVTRIGENFVGRMGASFLRALGHPEWVADSDEAYVAAVQTLAHDPAQLLRLQRGLRQAVQASPLGDIVRYARHFEGLVWQMARHAA